MQGEAQEARVRSSLINQGYEQLYGASDRDIRKRLQIVGKCADFVGCHFQSGKWLIAESKGNHVQIALEQIENTLHGLVIKEPDALGKTELRIYTNPTQYKRLTQHPEGTGGYYVQGNLLGYKPDGVNWVYAEIMGMKVRVLKEAER